MDTEYLTRIANELAERENWGQPSYIDCGASGAVFELNHDVHGIVALKIYDPKFFQGEDALISQKRIDLQTSLASLNHQNLIQTIDSGTIDEHSTSYIIMEYCPWKSLDKVIPDIPNDKVGLIIRQLAEVIIFLQSNDIIHRDIKPANIAISENFDQIKVLDMGVMRSISYSEGNGTDVDEKKRFVATAQYSPPEYILRAEIPGQDGFDALNIYQTGAVLHDLIMKRPIFHEEASLLNRYLLFSKITEKIPVIYNTEVPAKLVSLCRASLEKDANKRIAAVKMEDFTTHHDTANAVRKRLEARKLPRPNPDYPSLLIWKSKIMDWIALAVAAERSILGPATIEEGASNQSMCSWNVGFDDFGIAVYFELSQLEDTGGLSFTIAATPHDNYSPICSITNSGPNLPDDQIIDQVRQQILYTVDSINPDTEN